LTAGIGIMAINPSLYSKLPYDPIKDFEAITLLAKMPNMLAVSPALPVKSVSELIALAKAKPGVLNYGSAGSGSNPHILAEYFKLRTNTDIQDIPYKGVPPALSDLIAGQLSMVFATVPTVLPQAKAGRVRALAVTSAKRLALVPELPTIAEAGVPDYEATQWIGMLAPAGTPKDIVAQLNARIVKTLQRADVRERLGTEMVEPVGSTPDYKRFDCRSESSRGTGVPHCMRERATHMAQCVAMEYDARLLPAPAVEQVTSAARALAIPSACARPRAPGARTALPPFSDPESGDSSPQICLATLRRPPAVAD
jgi:hypothetical protein